MIISCKNMRFHVQEHQAATKATKATKTTKEAAIPAAIPAKVIANVVVVCDLIAPLYLHQ